MICDKIKDRLDCLREIREARAEGKSVVFTNGCFDLLHSGHASYLEEARALGDILVVGLNSDASVKRLKGQNRPIVSQAQRMKLLAAMESVSYVIIFEEDTPLELIRLVQPDILVKGGDWQPESIVGADLVLSGGGKVVSLSFEDGISTTELVKRIRERG